ncbi:YcxB family protein [Gracilibacillus timonensis]|uniref:YcxB family protein n=1 Tax=Gracilibacillus timonensis TaxID=1816696 RepID=UPI0008267C51|nr:YcxB family protein [Gracilibacillus timonensis]
MSEYQEIHASGTITYNEFQKYNSYHSKKTVIAISLFSFFSIVLLGIIIADGSYFILVPFSIILASIVAVISILILVTAFRIRARREYNSDFLMTKEITYTINDNGITQQITKKSHNFIEWNYIVKGYEDDDMFRLYVSRNKAIVLPKRFFTSENDLTIFKKIISKNINKMKLN